METPSYSRASWSVQCSWAYLVVRRPSLVVQSATSRSASLDTREAMGVMSAVGAIGRMFAPQLFTRLWLRAVAQKGQPRALPLGAPFLSVALIALIQACQTLPDSATLLLPAFYSLSAPAHARSCSIELR